MKTNLQIPRNLGEDEGDVSIIISNLVENAVEACMRMLKGNRFIDIKAAPVGDENVILAVRA
ncbi:MAG: sensor histidine kinase [Ruminococcaceae bacterium]|nr:sensor histidine kinase [Oscillospiraceae bacterium]